ncbi:MAG: hypothetical protein GOU97_01475 [Nanoarchaeota archaeon]|nr:hypothetical protein [Nanoarchaeota archaeon]
MEDVHELEEGFGDIEELLKDDGLTVIQGYEDPVLKESIQRAYDEIILSKFPRLGEQVTEQNYEAYSQALTTITSVKSVLRNGAKPVEPYWNNFYTAFVPIIKKHEYSEHDRDVLFEGLGAILNTEISFAGRAMDYGTSVEAYIKWLDLGGEIREKLTSELLKIFHSPTKAKRIIGVIEHTRELTREDKQKLMPQDKKLLHCKQELATAMSNLDESEKRLLTSLKQ